jgi:hypothetical protein
MLGEPAVGDKNFGLSSTGERMKGERKVGETSGGPEPALNPLQHQ